MAYLNSPSYPVFSKSLLWFTLSLSSFRVDLPLVVSLPIASSRYSILLHFTLPYYLYPLVSHPNLSYFLSTNHPFNNIPFTLNLSSYIPCLILRLSYSILVGPTSLTATPPRVAVEIVIVVVIRQSLLDSLDSTRFRSSCSSFQPKQSRLRPLQGSFSSGMHAFDRADRSVRSLSDLLSRLPTISRCRFCLCGLCLEPTYKWNLERLHLHCDALSLFVFYSASISSFSIPICSLSVQLGLCPPPCCVRPALPLD